MTDDYEDAIDALLYAIAGQTSQRNDPRVHNATTVVLKLFADRDATIAAQAARIVEQTAMIKEIGETSARRLDRIEELGDRIAVQAARIDDLLMGVKENHAIIAALTAGLKAYIDTFIITETPVETIDRVLAYLREGMKDHE